VSATGRTTKSSLPGKLSTVRGITAWLTCVAWGAWVMDPATAGASLALGRDDPPVVEIDWGETRRGATSEMVVDPQPPGDETAPAPHMERPSAGPSSTGPSSPSPAIPPPTVASAQSTSTPILVAIGLGADAPGSREEWAIVDRLESGLSASTEPPAQQRRLRTPIGAPRRVCRETGAALVLTVGYVAQRIDPSIAAWDCDIDLELGRWPASDAEEVGLLASIWSEHEGAIASGEAIAGGSARPRLPPKVRAGLIAGGVVLALGATLAILLAAGLR